MECRICGDEGSASRLFVAKEMMFGYGDEFTYFQCSKCGCLQILEVPENMARYYPREYYSMSSSVPGLTRNPVKRLTRKLRTRYAVFGRGLAERLAYALFPHEPLAALSRLSLTNRSRILDVGCGAGSYLYDLTEIGFPHLLGVDPYLAKDELEYGNGLRILKKPIHDLSGQWDLVMFHHSFEHVPDQLETLQSVARLLVDDGTCLLQMPTVSSYAWRHYGVNWVQLDAPRHLFLHSVESIGVLAQKAGLVLCDTVHNSRAFQFWGSEQYLRGIPLMSPGSYRVNPRESLFSPKDIAVYAKQARQLNADADGDQAAFYLRKKGRA